MTLGIRLNGETYTNFTSAQVERDMQNVCSTFSFSSTVGKSEFRTNNVPIQAGDNVEIVADGHKVMTGVVDEDGAQYDANNHTIPIKGRSKTRELVDCTVGATKEYEKVSLPDIANDIASGFGLKVINAIGRIEPFNDIASAETGQTAFSFLESLARKRQVLLSDNGEANVVLIRTSSALSPNNLTNKIGGIENNIKSASKTRNISGLFNQYTAQGQQSPISIPENPRTLTDDYGIAYDNEIASIRKYEFYTEETTDSFTLKDRAEWELSVRRANAFTYTCTVQGHSFNGVLWIPNNLHQIDDDFAALYGRFLLKKVIYKYDVSAGSETDLVFVNKNAFTLQATKDKIFTES